MDDNGIEISDAQSTGENGPTTISRTIDSWCFTNVKVSKFSHLWIINNFTFCKENVGESLKSTVFSPATNENVKWILRLSPRGLDDESKDFISLYLFLLGSNTQEVFAKFRFSVINAKGNEMKAMESQRAYRFVTGKDWGFKKFIRRDYLIDESNGLLNNDMITILCQVSAVTDCTSIGSPSVISRIPVPECDLSSSMEQLLNNQVGCDIDLIIDGCTLKAHRYILSMRSPVFAAMFEHRLKENVEGRVEIVDLSREVMQEVLKYIYTGKTPAIETMAEDLLIAADKYDLVRLKFMCEKQIAASLTVQNVCQTAILAAQHQANHLRAATLEFISLHASDVLKTPCWSTLETNHPTIVADVLRSLTLFSDPPSGGTTPIKRPKSQRDS